MCNRDPQLYLTPDERDLLEGEHMCVHVGSCRTQGQTCRWASGPPGSRAPGHLGVSFHLFFLLPFAFLFSLL